MLSGFSTFVSDERDDLVDVAVLMDDVGSATVLDGLDAIQNARVDVETLDACVYDAITIFGFSSFEGRAVSVLCSGIEGGSLWGR